MTWPLRRRRALGLVPALVAGCVRAPTILATAPQAELLTAQGRWQLRVQPGAPPILHLRLDPRLPLPPRATAPAAAGRPAPQTPDRHYLARALDGRSARAVSLVQAHPGRRAFLLVLDGIDELWELSLDVHAPPIFNGWVHDHRMGEGLGEPGSLVPADAAAAVWLRVPSDPRGPATVLLVHLDVRRVIARFTLPARPAPDRLQLAGTLTAPRLRLSGETGPGRAPDA
jgi:hypothetical protein